jgi:hypothetical protein
MPWGVKIPDLKNNPLYLEPRVTAAETSLAENTSKVEVLVVQTQIKTACISKLRQQQQALTMVDYGFLYLKISSLKVLKVFS